MDSLTEGAQSLWETIRRMGQLNCFLRKSTPNARVRGHELVDLRDEASGQDRAAEALEVGLRMESAGFNMYVPGKRKWESIARPRRGHAVGEERRFSIRLVSRQHCS